MGMVNAELQKNISDFIQWTEQEQIHSKSQYVKRSCPQKNANGDLVTYYFCNRHGLYQSKISDKERRSMIQAKGTSKIGLSCLARMVTTFSSKDEKVHVRYCSTHVGHKLQMCYLNLPESQERLIAGKIKEGVHLDYILDEIRDKVISSTILEKKHFLNKKKLFNIMRKYNLAQGGRYHKIDEVSVDILVEECKCLDHNPILLFKKQGIEHKILDGDEFMIIIMTKMQREVLKKFGTKTICIDSTHSTNQYDFQLTTVMTLDEYREGFPSCFCVSRPWLYFLKKLNNRQK